jgi:NADH-quinone oxidoreductase subunit L
MGVAGAVMTAFYMSRLFMLTFMGDFKGWKIVPGWHDPHAHDHDHHDHAHHDHSHDAPAEGPEPHESPWPMWLPLAVLAFLALLGGVFNAHALLHWHPLDDFLEPVFRNALQSVNELENAKSLEIPLLIPGVLAFAAGVGGAYWVYVAQRGAPAKRFVERFPGLHRLVSEKWRIDELYDELVVSTLDSLAEFCVWIDRWVVDGIIARLSSFIVAIAGHVLRLLQTGHLHAYAATTVLAMVGIGWFVMAPHAAASIARDKSTVDTVVVQAPPGLGYQYRWDSNGDGEFDSDDFTDQRELQVKVGPKSPPQHIQLEVKNAFGTVAQGGIEILPSMAGDPVPVPAPVPAAPEPEAEEVAPPPPPPAAMPPAGMPPAGMAPMPPEAGDNPQRQRRRPRRMPLAPQGDPPSAADNPYEPANPPVPRDPRVLRMPRPAGAAPAGEE